VLTQSDVFVCKVGRDSRIISVNICIYARISTDGQSIDSQLLELRGYCDRRSWTNIEEITDTTSGAKVSRKGLDRLMALVRRGKVDIVVTYKLDRVGRSLSHLAQIVDEFATHKVGLVIPSQGIDTTTKNAVAQAQLGMLAVFAEFERSMIVERVHAGLAAAKARGVKLGRPSRRNPNTDQVAKLREKGMSGRMIAKQLGLTSSLVFKIIIGQLKASKGAV
jgi:DNA invertase Pin-like site-specific DNA recombinase